MLGLGFDGQFPEIGKWTCLRKGIEEMCRSPDDLFRLYELIMRGLFPKCLNFAVLCRLHPAPIPPHYSVFDEL